MWSAWFIKENGKFLSTFFINSNPNLTKTQIFTLKLTSNLTLIQTLTQTLIWTLKKVNKKCGMHIPHFCFIHYNLKFFGEIVDPKKI